MEIIRMNGNGFKSMVLVAACGWGLWKVGYAWFGPAVKAGEVAMLTETNYPDVQREAGTLLAIFTKPG